jgi:hypothetical protein
MSTLIIRRSGGAWVVADGSADIAASRGSPIRDYVDIDVGGRALRADIPRSSRKVGPGSVFVVSEPATGEQLVRVTYVPRRDSRVRVQEWAVRFTAGPELAWVYQLDTKQCGFYDSAANPVMMIGHHLPFEVPRKASVLRILFSMWTGAAKAKNRYAAEFDERALTAVGRTTDASLLALLGMHLKRRLEVEFEGPEALGMPNS